MILDWAQLGSKKRKKEQRRQAVKHIAAGTVIGLAAGVAAGILLAPKAGREIRTAICSALRELPDKTRDIVKEAEEKLAAVKAKTKEEAKSVPEAE